MPLGVAFADHGEQPPWSLENPGPGAGTPVLFSLRGGTRNGVSADGSHGNRVTYLSLRERGIPSRL